VAVLLDAAGEGRRGDKRAVLRTALDTHAPQVVLSAAAAIYGLVGLVAGSFLAELVVSAFGALASTRRGAARAVAARCLPPRVAAARRRRACQPIQNTAWR